MATMHAVLPAADAITLDLVLEGAARTAKAHGDTRTLDELRADALSLLGHTAHTAGHIGHGGGHASPDGAATATSVDHARQAPPGPMKIGHIGRTRPQIRITVPLSVALPEDLADVFASRRRGDPPLQGRTVPSRSHPPPAPSDNGKSPP